jgi:hypothetical protein
MSAILSDAPPLRPSSQFESTLLRCGFRQLQLRPMHHRALPLLLIASIVFGSFGGTVVGQRGLNRG